MILRDWRISFENALDKLDSAATNGR
jgi:hypothetical protein